MTGALPVLAGYLLDAVLGDPRWLPHPVQGIGWLIASGERVLNRGRPGLRLITGALLTMAVVGLAAAIAWGVVEGARLLHPRLGGAVTAVGTGVLLARRSLAEQAGTAVHRPLAAGDIDAARRAVSWVVGRDTERLDESEVARAAVETLAENLSDGVAAPLIFALVGGLPAIAAYKAINTLDSMIGHRDDRYLYFGRVAARLDDVANWIPARITLLALVLAAALSGGGAGAAWRVARADGHKHKSPNAGWPEAAMAGALGVRLGGLNYYDGEPHPGPILNAAGRPPVAADILAAVRLMNRASHLILVTGLLMYLCF
ncbi:MAG TPA: adenosylcobinamide-phosphate synthase CbiB [Symbiobacteriaceae bacterium]|nr:adenosylcobinamide-phosphate synthase CbiB [Symbiobacteriaceae bacterium]